MVLIATTKLMRIWQIGIFYATIFRMDDKQNIEEIRVELKKIMEMTKVNYALLRSINHRANLSLLFSSLRWIVVIGIAIGTYYYLQPYMQELAAMYQKVTGSQLDFFKMFRGF